MAMPFGAVVNDKLMLYNLTLLHMKRRSFIVQIFNIKTKDIYLVVELKEMQ